jgi:DNA polymerase-1
MKHRILLVDVSGLLHRVKFALINQRLSHEDKETGIIFGFLMQLQFIKRKTNSNIVVFALDSRTSKRKKIYSEYKEKRRKEKTEKEKIIDEIAFQQFDQVENYVLKALGYNNIFREDGLEADDIIGSICKTYKSSEITIASSDQDMYQLLTNRVNIFNFMKSSFFTIDDFRDKYGIEPIMWKRVKAIGGCSSDCVAGIPGVGEKTVIKFIKGELPKTYKTYKAIVSPEGRKIIARNKKLVILPFRGTPSYRLFPDNVTVKSVKEVAEKYGMNSILSDIKGWFYSLS